MSDTQPTAPLGHSAQPIPTPTSPPQAATTRREPEQQGAPAAQDEPSGPKRALIIGAHPDDPEFGCGGTAAAWVAAGHEVHYVVVTNGEKGSADLEMTREGLVPLRETEQEAAAAVIGAKSVTFLRFPDGELYPDLRLREAIVRAIRTIRPDAVFTHDPATIYGDSFINHPDHRAVGQATLDAIYPSARDRLVFPEHEREGLVAHKVREVYLWGSTNPNEWVDIDHVFDRKVAAITRHQTQVKDATGLAERMRERAKAVGEAQGLEAAEAFRKITMGR